MPAVLPYHRHDDAELARRVAAGDSGAFATLDSRHRAALTRYAGSLVRRSEHDAEDVVQDALIRAYHGLRATDRPMALRPWLYMIVRNRALDALRTPQRADSYDDELLRMRPVADADPAYRSEQRDEMRFIVDEIARLPERQRIALVMREFDGRTHAETAEALDTTVPATKSLIIRARSNLGHAVLAAA